MNDIFVKNTDLTLLGTPVYDSSKVYNREYLTRDMKKSTETKSEQLNTTTESLLSDGDSLEQWYKENLEKYNLYFKLYPGASTGGQYTQNTTSVKKYTDRNLFVHDLFAAYKNAGFNNDVAMLLVALDALESRYGESSVGAFNFSNIKATTSWDGPTRTATDNMTGSTDAYREYPSLYAYIKDKILLLRKYGVTTLDNAETALNKIVGLNPAALKWAEDPNYANKLRSVTQSIARYVGNT